VERPDDTSNVDLDGLSLDRSSPSGTVRTTILFFSFLP